MSILEDSAKETDSWLAMSKSHCPRYIAHSTASTARCVSVHGRNQEGALTSSERILARILDFKGVVDRAMTYPALDCLPNAS